MSGIHQAHQQTYPFPQEHLRQSVVEIWDEVLLVFFLPQNLVEGVLCLYHVADPLWIHLLRLDLDGVVIPEGNSCELGESEVQNVDCFYNCFGEIIEEVYQVLGRVLVCDFLVEVVSLGFNSIQVEITSLLLDILTAGSQTKVA